MKSALQVICAVGGFGGKGGGRGERGGRGGRLFEKFCETHYSHM